MSDDEQGIINGVKHYSLVAVRSTAATARMIIAAGGDPLKAIDAAELTEHLAHCPPIDFVSDDDYSDELEADLVH